MVLDKLDNAEKYYSLHPGFQKAFEFLKSRDIENLSTGRHDIQGDEIYCIIAKDRGKKKDDAKLEFHNKYIDIQFLAKGSEQTGWHSRLVLNGLYELYDENNDIGFCEYKPANWIDLHPGMFVIFFPEDLHAPMVSDEMIHKAVIKVRL